MRIEDDPVCFEARLLLHTGIFFSLETKKILRSRINSVTYLKKIIPLIVGHGFHVFIKKGAFARYRKGR
jgi:hypothetical protein